MLHRDIDALFSGDVDVHDAGYSCMVFATREAAEAYINEVLADGETNP